MCYSANAHAGLEAAIRKEPYIFRCHEGLVDVAVPIIVNYNYLGVIGTLKHLLPYHKLGVNKYECLGKEYKISDEIKTPTNEYMESLKVK